MNASAPWDEIDVALGRLARAWSTVELLLRELLENLAALDPYTGGLFHYRMPAATLIRHCRDLAGGFNDDTEAQRVRDWLDRADSLREKRNDFIHGTWALFGPPEARVTGLLVSVPRPKQGVLEQRRSTVTAGVVDALKEEVIQLTRDFGQMPLRQGHIAGVNFLTDEEPPRADG